jgi:hypothetical protein
MSADLPAKKKLSRNLSATSLTVISEDQDLSPRREPSSPMSNHSRNKKSGKFWFKPSSSPKAGRSRSKSNDGLSADEISKPKSPRRDNAAESIASVLNSFDHDDIQSPKNVKFDNFTVTTDDDGALTISFN